MNPVFSDRADPALQSRKGEFPKIRGTYKGSFQGVLLGYDKGSFKGLYKGFEFPKIRGTPKRSYNKDPTMPTLRLPNRDHESPIPLN